MFVDYTRGQRDDLDVTVSVEGGTEQMFNEREISHMVDVKNLYLAGVQIAYFLGGVAIVAFTAPIYHAPKKEHLCCPHKGFADIPVCLCGARRLFCNRLQRFLGFGARDSFHQ